MHLASLACSESTDGCWHAALLALQGQAKHKPPSIKDHMYSDNWDERPHTYIYIYTYIYTYTHCVCIYIYIYLFIYMCVCTYMQIYDICVRIYTCMYVYIYILYTRMEI